MLSIIKTLFHFHKYQSFKAGKFPLIAVYCTKCGKIKFGNSIYYDGSVYHQKSYKGLKAIAFIQERITFLKNRDKLLVEWKQIQGINPDLFDYNELRFRENYETIEKYKEIINIISNSIK